VSNKKLIIASILYIIFISFEFYISWFLSVISTIITFIFYAFFIYLITQTLKSLFKRDNIIFNKEKIIWFLKIFYYRVSLFLSIFFIIIWWFAYYQNDYNPAKMPIYEMSNWDKTVVFIAMSHIWSENFYEEVKNRIIQAKKEWFVYFFEWVKPWTKENQDKFNKALWITLDEKTYENMSKIYGLTNQDNSKFLNQVNDKDINIDLSLDEIVLLYEQNWWLIKSLEWSTPIDTSKELINIIAWMNEKELIVFRYINKSFINAIIKSEDMQKTLQNTFANKKLFEVILHKRNDLIVDEIDKSKDKKIVITYWLLHFKWVYEALKKQDIKWQIKKIDYLYPLK